VNFKHNRESDEPDINLIPLIDVLLVILIFLAATTSFNRLSQFDIALPQARADAPINEGLTLNISQEGLYDLNGQLIAEGQVADIAAALSAANAQEKDLPLIINADAQSHHESVVRAMEAARLAGFKRISFATQSP